jgi:methionyl-tRNA formyltransferase
MQRPLRVLFLGSEFSPVVSAVLKSGASITVCGDELSLSDVNQFTDPTTYDFIVCYGYRHIIPPDIVRRMHRRIINLHISYLPWNRGADPNLWSWLENTPKGVTIHYIDEGVDTGDIITQKQIHFIDEERWTLTATYDDLNREIEELFQRWWPFISTNNTQSRKQVGAGSVHKTKDKEKYLCLLTERWSTPVSQLIGKGVKYEKTCKFTQ